MNTAVILAARKEKDSAIPYPVTPFAEETCLIDRTLDIYGHENETSIIL